MAPTNPARYGAKNSRPLATTVDEETFQTVTKLAAQGGISASAWLRQVIVEETKHSTVFRLGRVQKPFKYTPETTMMQEETGDICELPVPGSSPAKTPVRYQKSTGRKS